jgi:hypothetical protein
MILLCDVVTPISSERSTFEAKKKKQKKFKGTENYRKRMRLAIQGESRTREIQASRRICIFRVQQKQPKKK